jgi:hypothetical protein
VTIDQHGATLLLLESCTFPVGSPDKRFVRDMRRLYRSDPKAEVTEAQDAYLLRCLHRYRRQHGGCVCEECEAARGKAEKREADWPFSDVYGCVDCDEAGAVSPEAMAQAKASYRPEFCAPWVCEMCEKRPGTLAVLHNARERCHVLKVLCTECFAEEEAGFLTTAEEGGE